MSKSAEPFTEARFEDLLDAYGVDFARWPAGYEEAAASLLRRSTVACAIFDEAKALDALMSAATIAVSDPDRERRLADRIFAAAIVAGKGPRNAVETAVANPARPGARVIQLPEIKGRRGRDDHGRHVAPAVPADVANQSVRPVWRIASALAASLAFGIIIGLSDVAPDAAYAIASLTEPTATDVELLTVGLQFDAVTMLDEDQL
jgi:hypothetical protein